MEGKFLLEGGVFWGLMALTVSIWLAAIFYIVKGWGGSRETPAPEAPKVPLPKIEVFQPTPKLEEEIEIPIGEPSHEEIQPATYIDLEGFYQEFGKANIVEFPAEYIDRGNVKGLSGNKINIVEFAKNCYREIDFRCIDSVMVKQEGERTYKVNIFDLISDHYASTEEGFISYFGQLKERFAQEIQSISNHPDITPANKRVLIGRYENFVQLVVWNDRELFLVMVKSKDETLNKIDIDFFKEFVIEKKLFKARIFKVTQKQEKIEKIEKTYPLKKKIEIGEEKRILTGEVPRRRPFTKEEIRFLMENKDKFTNEELAKRLGRSIDSITHKLSRQGIARESYEWTKEKDDFLKYNITKLSYRELAGKLGTTAPSVRARCRKINVKK